MKKILKWIGIVLAGLVGLLLVAAVVLYILGSARLNRNYNIKVETIPIPTDEASIARGRHLVEALTFCKECHGQDLGGDLLVDMPGIATLYAPNLTSGRGGVGAIFSDADFVRAIRHGVDPQGRGLMIMHSDIYHNLSRQDLGAIIAFVRSVPPVDHEIPKPSAEPLGRILIPLGAFDHKANAMALIPAEVIDQGAPFADAPPQGPTAEYGGYLVSITLCHICHGPELTGAPSLEAGKPPGPNLVALGAPGGWTAEQFVSTIRTGVTPYGNQLNPDFMPWDKYTNLTDDELVAIWRYVQSLAGE